MTTLQLQSQTRTNVGLMRRTNDMMSTCSREAAFVVPLPVCKNVIALTYYGSCRFLVINGSCLRIVHYREYPGCISHFVVDFC